MAEVKFDPYGDIEFFSGDIEVISGEHDIIYQLMVDRITSSDGDYDLLEDYSASISGYMGRPVDQSLADEIRKKLYYILTHDLLVDPKALTVLTKPSGNKILIRLSLGAPGTSLISENINIKASLDVSTGMVYVTN